MEVQSERKRTRRKIRCTEDFNQLNRTSLAVPTKNALQKNTVTRKNKNLFHLPQIDLNICKENCSPNKITSTGKKSRKVKKTSGDLEEQFQIKELSPPKRRLTRSVKKSEELSTEEEKRDSEIEFKKKRKRKKKLRSKSDKESSSSTTTVSENEIIVLDLNKASPAKLTPKIMNVLSKVSVDFQSIDNTNVPLSSPRKSEEIFISGITTRTRKKSVLKMKKKQSTHSSEYWAPTSTSSEELVDDVFTSQENLSETLDICEVKDNFKDNVGKKRDTFELQNSTFNVSDLPIVEDVKSPKKSLYENGHKGIASSTRSQSKRLRSKSVYISPNLSIKRSSNVITPHQINISKNETDTNSMDTTIKHASITSLNMTRKSVTFEMSSSKKRRSKSLDEKEISKVYPKSPHVSRLTIISDISDLKEISSQEEPTRTKLETRSQLQRTKLPNFALIHQRAYEQMENVKEMSQRKAVRAQQLLSGKKPGQETSLKAPTSNLKIKSPTLRTKSPKSRKLLRYSPRKQSSPAILKKSGSNLTINRSQGKVNSSASKNSVSIPSASSMVINKNLNKFVPSTSNPKILKPAQKKVEKSLIPKAMTIEKPGLSKLGFKIVPGINKISRQEELKAVVNKTHIQRGSLESRRNGLKNVRTNRRFELLMKMRNKNA